jgi:NADPH:quinone reductase-like Zn-dependent oxidoreductase
MRAVAVPDFGSEPEVMELPVPRPGPGEILLRIHAAGMNPFDWKVADGALRDAVPHAFPLILGNDAAGVVNFYNSSSAELLATLADLARSGKLRVQIDTNVPLAQAPAALATARTGHARGKTVIIPDEGA